MGAHSKFTGPRRSNDANEASGSEHDVELVPSGVPRISPNLMPSLEVCELLGCTPDDLESLAKRGLLIPLDKGKTATGLFSPSDVLAYLTR